MTQLESARVSEGSPEQELRGFVTKFKSLLHDDAAIDQEEETTSMPSTAIMPKALAPHASIIAKTPTQTMMNTATTTVIIMMMATMTLPNKRRQTMMLPQTVGVIKKGLRANLEYSRISLPSSIYTIKPG